MISRSNVADILTLLRCTPEQALFDWKADFVPPRTADTKGEIVKDVMAIANATAFAQAPGYIIYGVDPRQPDPILGISEQWDDAWLQQLLGSHVDPAIDFAFYELDGELGRTLAIIHIPPTRGAFHIVAKDVGRLREGQSLIREGSTTRGVTHDDHIRLYLDPQYGWVNQVLLKYGALAQLKSAQASQLTAIGQTQNQLVRQMEAMSGLPRGSLG